MEVIDQVFQVFSFYLIIRSSDVRLFLLNIGGT